MIFELVIKKDIRSWIETIPISEKKLSEGLTRCVGGDVKYRFVLIDFNKAFK